MRQATRRDVQFLALLALAAAAAPPAGGQCPAGTRFVARVPDTWPTLPSRPNATEHAPAACAGADCRPPWELQFFDADFWDRARLARAAVAAHSADAWLPLLAKLQAGRPIVVLAFGSSIVDGHAGCFASRATVAAAGVGALPQAMWRSLNGSEPDARCALAGYASAFLAAVNATWPHPEHVLINAGMAGTMLGQFARDACTDGWLPMARGADLLLFETHGGPDEDAAAALRDIERLYYETVSKLPPLRNATSALAQAVPPPLVLLHMHPIGPTLAVNGTGDDGSAACVGRFGLGCAECGGGDALAARLEAAAGRGVEDGLAVATRRYGWSALSFRDALLAALRDGSDTKKLNWTSCQLINAFMKDRVHPSLPGRRLLADALIQLLLQTQDAALARPECAAAGAPGVPLPLAPLSRGAWTRPERRCTLAEQLRPRLARGWAFHETELVRNYSVHKPGWLADQPGAALEVNIGSTRLATLPRSARARLDVRFLVSYERMGAARLTCVAGCICRAATLQAHQAVARESVEGAYGVGVSQAGECVVRLTTLPDTASGGHRFKLIGFTVIAEHAERKHDDDDDDDKDDDEEDEDEKKERRDARKHAREGKRSKHGRRRRSV